MLLLKSKTISKVIFSLLEANFMINSKNINSKKFFNNLGTLVVSISGLFLILLTISIVYFIASQGVSTFFNNKVSIFEFLLSTKWNPESDIPQIGAGVFIFGSIIVSSLALLLSVPLSLSSSIFMTFISPKLGQKFLQPIIEIFVGIPSVVYGWIGISVLVPFIRNTVGGTGFSVLAGGIVLGLMIFPTITSVSVNALRAIPKDYKEASFALGATRWQTIRKVLVPAALPGILTGIVLGLARAFGEALAVRMVIGDLARLPSSVLDSTSTLTSIITMDMGNSISGTLWNNALWTMALLLLIITFVFILLIRLISGKMEGQK